MCGILFCPWKHNAVGCKSTGLLAKDLFNFTAAVFPIIKDKCHYLKFINEVKRFLLALSKPKLLYEIRSKLFLLSGESFSGRKPLCVAGIRCHNVRGTHYIDFLLLVLWEWTQPWKSTDCTSEQWTRCKLNKVEVGCRFRCKDYEWPLSYCH